jgi:hypothetical protein
MGASRSKSKVVYTISPFVGVSVDTLTARFFASAVSAEHTATPVISARYSATGNEEPATARNIAKNNFICMFARFPLKRISKEQTVECAVK